MSLGVAFHPDAVSEFEADVLWYEDREPGTGRRFRLSIGDALDDVVADTEAWAVWPGWVREPLVRSRRVNGFPYRMVYIVGNEVVTIVAVAHQRRRPGYWRDRVPSR